MNERRLRFSLAFNYIPINPNSIPFFFFFLSRRLVVGQWDPEIQIRLSHYRSVCGNFHFYGLVKSEFEGTSGDERER